jgi:hypothetical protein
MSFDLDSKTTGLPTITNTEQADLDQRREGKRKDLSLGDSILIATIHSGITPVKKKADGINSKLDEIEMKLSLLQTKKRENWEIEKEWELREVP